MVRNSITNVEQKCLDGCGQESYQLLYPLLLSLQKELVHPESLGAEDEPIYASSVSMKLFMLGSSTINLDCFPPYSSSCVEFNHISSRARLSLEFQEKEHKRSLSCSFYWKIVCSRMWKQDWATTHVSKTHTVGDIVDMFL